MLGRGASSVDEVIMRKIALVSINTRSTHLLLVWWLTSLSAWLVFVEKFKGKGETHPERWGIASGALVLHWIKRRKDKVRHQHSFFSALWLWMQCDQVLYLPPAIPYPLVQPKPWHGLCCWELGRGGWHRFSSHYQVAHQPFFCKQLWAFSGNQLTAFAWAANVIALISGILVKLKKASGFHCKSIMSSSVRNYPWQAVPQQRKVGISFLFFFSS